MTISDSISGAINAYLDRNNTQYAIMIDGAWGVGKTHFVINSLIPMRTTTEFVYASLYGLKSFDEIDIEISAQMEASNSTKDRPIATGIDSWPKIVKEVVGIDYVSRKSRQISAPVENSKPGHSVVICLDDLERWHGDLDLCLSYVNRLVEHKNLKCILIGNLDEMPSQSVSTFSNAREKTIRHIYHYDSDYHKIIDISLDLVDYSSHASRAFLRSIIQENFSSLEKLLDEVSVKNIRIITEAFQLYEYIYRNNSGQFNLSRNLAFTYLMTLFSVLILITRYLVDKKDRDGLLKGSHATNKGFKFLSDIGYFEDQQTGIINSKSRRLLDTIFYRLDQISLKGLFSIVSKGYYISADFEGEFDSWLNEQHYDSYLDKDHYYQLTDHDAQQVFNVMLSSVIDSHNITNPVTLLLLAERIISDIACGVVDYNPIDFKRQFLETVNALYDSGQMQYMEVSIFDIEGNRFSNFRGIYNHILKRNNDYHLAAHKTRLSNFWSQILKSPENIDTLLAKSHPKAVFSNTVHSEEIINALESLNNTRLYQIVKWIEDGFDNPSEKVSISIDPNSVSSVNQDIRIRYGNQTGIRANHLRQIAEIIVKSDQPGKSISDSGRMKTSLEI